MSSTAPQDIPQLTALPAVLRLGTRRSALAMAQSRAFADTLEAAVATQDGSVSVELVQITSMGDQLTGSLAALGGAGVFVSSLRDALLADEVDFVVHSLKDLPTAPADGLSLIATPNRADARDVLIARDGMSLGELPAGSVIGTGSPRRAAQLRALGLGLVIQDIRGNVDTRINKVTHGELDGVILARAGLLRLGREAEATEVLDPLQMVPAPAQGALGIECRSDESERHEAIRWALGLLDDPFTRACVLAERALLARLEAGCAAPVGALADIVEGDDGPELYVRAVVGDVAGEISIRRSLTRPLPSLADARTGTVDAVACAQAVDAGTALAEELLAEGADQLIVEQAGGTDPPLPSSALSGRGAS